MSNAPDFDHLREQMVQRQIIARGVTEPRVLQAVRTVQRHEFVSADRQRLAYDDAPLAIGLGQTISQPYIVAWMTQLLAPTLAQNVLEIGTGCGYQTAVLAQLARHVYSIERIEDLSKQAALNLNRAGVTNVSLAVGDGFKGWPARAPYQCIIVTAAPPVVPSALVNQLGPGGRMVLPVGGSGLQQMVRITRRADGSLQREELGAVSFVPMLPSSDGTEK